MLIYDHKKKLFTDGRTTQNYSSEPHKNINKIFTPFCRSRRAVSKYILLFIKLFYSKYIIFILNIFIFYS
jgi:hypothetical protein